MCLHSSKDNTSKVSRISGADKKVLWEEKIEGGITSVAASTEGMLVLATNQQKIFLLSAVGRRRFPPMLFSANVCQVLCADELVVALLENGLFYIWDISTFACIISDELPPSGLGIELVNLELRRMTNDIVLQFFFADNTKLVYSQIRKVFFQAEGSNAIDSIINAIWGEMEQEFYDASMIPKILAVDEKELRTRTLAHMEAQIAACSIVGDSVALVPWTVAYCQRLALEEDYYRASEFLQSLPQLGVDCESMRKVISSCFVKSPSALVRSLAD